MRPPRIVPPLLRVAALLHLAAGYSPDSSAANLTVDATHAVRTVDERDFGVNMVIWDQDGSTAQTISLLQDAGIRALRFPGGSLSDTYVWTKSKSYDTSTGMLNSWSWATSFGQFCSVVTGLNPTPQVFITANYGSGTPQMAAAWVAYANASATLAGTASDVTLGVDSRGLDWKTAGYWSALRAASPLATDDGLNFLRLGRAGPFGIKYWEIGNECYGNWEYDTHAVVNDPYTYANAAKDDIALMKAVDPTIKVGVVGITGEDAYATYTTHPATNPRTGVVHNGWTPVMLATLKALGVTPDFLIYHRYEQTPGKETDATLLQDASTWPNDASNLRQMLSDYLGAAGANVELDVTENNSVYSDPGKQTTSIVNGLYLADSVGHLLQTEFNSLLWWDFRNGPPTDSSGGLLGNQSSSLYGWRLYGDYGMLSMPSTATGETTYYDAYPTYHVMKLLSHFARGGDTVVSASSDDSLLSIFAVKRADGTLGLLVINKSPTATTTGTFALTGFTPTATATTYSYGIPQDEAARTGVGSTDIATSTLSDVATAFSVAFMPYSATVLSLSPESVAITTQPMSQIVTAGNSVMFSVLVGSGSGATYQWQRQAAGSGIWANVADNSTYSGSTTSTLTVNGTTGAMSGDSFQCVVTVGGSSATSAAATLTVNAPAPPPSGGGGGGSGGGGLMEIWFVGALGLLAAVGRRRRRAAPGR